MIGCVAKGELRTMSEETTDYKREAEDALEGAGRNRDAQIERYYLGLAQVAATLHLADMVEKYGKKIAAELDYIRKRMP